MKQLILMRHGKSDWGQGVSDRERPLQARGVRDATLVTQVYGERGHSLDFVFSSPAKRAFDTAQIFVQGMDHPLDRFQVVPALYDFSGEGVRAFVGQLDEGLDTVALFGHNNALTTLANAWGDRYIGNLPTAGLVHLVFGEDRWSEITKGKIGELLFPKQLNP